MATGWAGKALNVTKITISHIAQATTCAAWAIGPFMQVITTTQDLTAACESLARHDFVTVDTEFMRESTFWPKLCLIQLASPDDELIVDPLAPDIDLAPFYALMANEAVVKVFHAARQDVEIVQVQAGIIPLPLFPSSSYLHHRSHIWLRLYSGSSGAYCFFFF